MRAVIGLIAVAWLAAIFLQVTGHATELHHHALIEGDALESGRGLQVSPPPLWLGLAAFLLAWQVTIASMMLPASLRAVRTVVTSPFVGRSGPALLGFLAAYSVVWTGFGLAAFAGDIGLHHLVDASPWLEARPWLVQAAVLGLAGAYQLLPLRHRALQSCRHPGAAAAPGSDGVLAFRSGLGHALDCLVCSWALMLVMFAAGFANLAWMAVLTVAMVYEALGRHGARFGFGLGVGLLALAGLAATGMTVGF